MVIEDDPIVVDAVEGQVPVVGTVSEASAPAFDPTPAVSAEGATTSGATVPTPVEVPITPSTVAAASGASVAASAAGASEEVGPAVVVPAGSTGRGSSSTISFADPTARRRRHLDGWPA